MILKTIKCSLICAVFVSTSIFAEDSKFYVQLNAGAAFPQSFSEGKTQCQPSFGCSSFSYKERADTGYAASIALGYRITDAFRLEGEAMYQSSDMNKYFRSFSGPFGNFKESGTLQGERERIAFLLNAYYDFKNSTPFTPYLTVGLGGYHMRIKSTDSNPFPSRENDLDFAWQVGAGLNYKITDIISFDLRYRYFSGSSAELTLSSPNSLFRNFSELHSVGDHQILAGIRVGF